MHLHLCCKKLLLPENLNCFVNSQNARKLSDVLALPMTTEAVVFR